MNYNKIDDENSLAPTLRAPPRISQRPTIPAPQELPIKHATIKYKFYLIGIIIVTVIILSIVFITKPLQSQVMYEHRVFNLAPIVIPADQIIKEEAPANKSEAPVSSTSSKPAPKAFRPIQINKSRDYGI